MIRNTQSSRLSLPVSILLILLAVGAAQAALNKAGNTFLVEEFTTTELPVTGEAALDAQPGFGRIEFHLYDMDGVQRIETKLSEGLAADPEQSKQVVLQRLQQLHEEDRARMQRAAMGLAKAAQYSIDRYPAIVFDETVVVYGVTDLVEALRLYRRWREAGDS